MKYSILTLFPNIISAYINESIVKKAIDRNLIDVEIIDIRNFAYQPHNQVDEYQAGGGKGMVLMVEPIVKAIESVKTNELKTLIILTTPQGQTWHQQKAKELANTYEHLIIICGHYEGFDERILKYIDVEVSIGDYVLTGGELPALIIVDSVSRMIKTVINEESSLNESFENNLLDYPVYTKPVDFRGDIIPDVLLSGHHANIQKFRDEQQIIKTYQNRPDLINESKLNKVQLNKLKELKGEK